MTNEMKLILSRIPEAYEVFHTEYIDAIKSNGVALKHKKSGAVLFLILNDDENKLFCVSFKTPPEDDCGTPHIIEHSVLCGSEKYPVKDPFMQLVKGSMYTFLNAMTYPDKTVYPVSSCNDKDFINLSNVYLDAVFAPNITKHREIFMQEGIRLEVNEAGSLEYGGVVYSEMKGAVSSPDSNVFDELIYALFPDNAYGKNSGGDPEAIEELTYDKFLDFYKRHYHPSNAFFFLYGNLDFVERLEYIDREYLSKFDRTDVDTEIKEQKLFGEIRKKEVLYPIPAGESEEGKTFLAYGSVFCDALDTLECYATDFLADILVESPGAPVKTALIDAGIGSEVYGGFLNHMKKPAFSVIAKNTDESRREDFLTIIEDTLRRISEDGVSKKSLLAAIERSEFKFREGEQGATSKGLSLALGMMQSVMFTLDDPFRYLKFDEILEKLRELVETDYFDKLALKIAHSAHRALLVLKGKAGLAEEHSSRLQEKLSAIREAMSAEELEKLEEDLNRFEEYQDAEDDAELVKCIPVLSKLDIPRECQPVFNREGVVGGLPAVFHDIPVNGLVYVRFLFDISHVPTDKLPLLDLAVSVFGKADTYKTPYSDLLDEIRLNTGGFGINCTSYRRYGEKDSSRLMLELSLRMLPTKTERACELAREVLLETDFTNKKRIGEILAETVSEKERDILYAGSEYASSRALAYLNSADAVDDMIDGLSSYSEQKKLLAEFDTNADTVISDLTDLVKNLVNRNSCFVSVTVDSENYDTVEKAVRTFAEVLPDREALPAAHRTPLGKLNEGILTASGVQYVAQAGNLFDAGYSYDGAYQILASMLRNDYLYPAIRMKGGAYGYSCSFAQSTGNVTFSTYRDPLLKESYDVFASCGDFIRSKIPTDDELNRYIVGTFGKLDRPMTPYVRAIRFLSVYMTGITVDDMQRDRSSMLDCNAEKLCSLAESIDKVISQNYRCTIGNEEKLLENKELFVNTLRLL